MPSATCFETPCQTEPERIFPFIPILERFFGRSAAEGPRSNVGGLMAFPPRRPATAHQQPRRTAHKLWFALLNFLFSRYARCSLLSVCPDLG